METVDLNVWALIQQGALSTYPLLASSIVVVAMLTLGCGDSTLRISPPLVIDKSLMDEGLEILEASITEAEAEGLAD